MARISVSRDQFNGALERYRAAGRSADDIGELEWLWCYMFGEHKGDYEIVADQLDVHPTNVYKICMGKYEGELDNMLERIRRLRKRAAAKLSTLVETCVTRRICEALDYARDYRAFVMVLSETGRGKTCTARTWQRANNHGLAHYIRLPSACTRAKLVRLVAETIGVGTSDRRSTEIEAAIFRGIGKDKVLIFDEAGHAIPTGSRKDRSAIEFIRDLFDICECGVVLLMTDVYWREIRQGRQAAFFEQFRGRSQYRLEIPKGKIFADEVQALCAAYAGKKPDRDLVTAAAAIAKQDGKLRTLCDDLAKARNFAQQAGKPLSAEILVAARQWREAGGVWTEETV